MADIEAAAGAEGAEREWLARAARAPRDRAWIASGVVSDRWVPVSPSGALDAFVWRAPEERLSAPEPSPRPAPAPEPAVLVAPAPATAEPPAPEVAPAAEVAPATEAPPAEIATTPKPKPEPPRAAAPFVLLPSSAPDDPGPGEESERKPGFRLFARE
jgi:HemY protein